MPWCPYHPGGRVKWVLRKKNIPDTCCIDIKTKADKEEEGQEGKEDWKWNLCSRRRKNVFNGYIQNKSQARKERLTKIKHSSLFCYLNPKKSVSCVNSVQYVFNQHVIVTRKIDGTQITSVRIAGLTEFEPRDTEKSPLSVLTGVRIKRVNFRNCPLHTGDRIKWVFRLVEIKILCLSSSY